MAEAFSEKELKAIVNGDPPKLKQKETIELYGEIQILIDRFLATITADRKRFNEVELNYLKIVAENAITIADQTVVIEMLRGLIRRWEVDFRKADMADLLEQIRQALDAGKERGNG